MSRDHTALEIAEVTTAIKWYASVKFDNPQMQLLSEDPRSTPNLPAID
ncbi:hypothetical protein [Mucilaginibacter ginkgonis]|uniref:Uncharacterized protein n=1 Tax=Mucilaginibacter ginkgonis TaxID=2682091 RepID=A0A7T7JH19_9SPHI|nr:hypothetical protein [Mucilaginibacter ginkgonis]QQL50138.1 hypothetical protein GO620_001420 [Mucilaginibacter ginkgonis]